MTKRQKGWGKRIPEFSFNEGRANGPGSVSYQNFQALWNTAARTAQSLRQRWLTPTATEVDEKLEWANENNPPPLFFPRFESALSMLIESAGRMRRSAYGGRGVSDSDVNSHVNSIVELDEINDQAREQIHSAVCWMMSPDLARDLQLLSTQVSALLAHVDSSVPASAVSCSRLRWHCIDRLLFHLPSFCSLTGALLLCPIAYLYQTYRACVRRAAFMMHFCSALSTRASVSCPLRVADIAEKSTTLPALLSSRYARSQFLLTDRYAAGPGRGQPLPSHARTRRHRGRNSLLALLPATRTACSMRELLTLARYRL